MGMLGNLKDMAVADLIQHNCQDQKTAQLTIQHAGHECYLYFKQGSVVHAALDSQEYGEEVVFKILSWEEGTFNLETGVEPPEMSITRSWSALLLEGARLLDEQDLDAQDLLSPQPTQTEVNSMAQKLDDILKELSGDVGGYMASAVIGLDGLNIAQHSRGKVNTEAVGAQLTLLLKLVDTSITKLGAGTLEDNLLTTENSYVLTRFLPDKQYFLGVAIDRKSGSLGNLRLMSKLYGDRIAKAMPR